MRACPVCEAQRSKLVAAYRYQTPLFAKRSRAECGECGMVFASPMPDESAVAAYNERYFFSAHGGVPTDPVAIAFHSAINRLRVDYVERALSGKGIALRSVLEIGPGSGYFARHWLQRHPGMRYFAVESDESVHATLKGLGIEIVGAGVPSVDLVVMSHVLEHAVSPVDFLKKMTASLRPGGALFVEVPCRDFEHKPVDEPHLLFFDKAPLVRLLRRLGLEPVHAGYYGREIQRLRGQSAAERLYERLRNRLIRRGIVAPFAKMAPGLEVLESPLERAAVAPFLAHREQQRPAWWLRAIASKAH